jgi:NAD(P)-dependent dehydrogenase (short-subunit alcohol dehydrogenase family)
VTNGPTNKAGSEAAPKSVVVIGGTGGIGHAIAEFYAKQGNQVLITGRDATRTAGIAKEMGAKVRGIGLDISEPETIEAALADLPHIDHLALVAVDRDYNSARDYDVARARKIVTLKLIGYTEVAHTLFPRMGAGASAVLFGGLASERPYPGSTSITTVNGAVSSLIRTLAVELAPVRFNAIHPGIISDSPQWSEKKEAIANIEKRTPGGRLATTEDVVGAVDFLFMNRGVNGINLVIDGGWLLT